jgi:hypothetical protein
MLTALGSRPKGARMGLLEWLFGGGPSQPFADNEFLEPVHLARGDGFNFNIVGEASYQPALDTICGGKCEEGHQLSKLAQLCFQEDNPYDPNAVVVFIDRRVVGYVPRNLAKEIREAILRLNPEERPVTCDAQVVGGWRRDWQDDEGHYGVKLSLSYPLKIAT